MPKSLVGSYGDTLLIALFVLNMAGFYFRDFNTQIRKRALDLQINVIWLTDRRYKTKLTSSSKTS